MKKVVEIERETNEKLDEIKDKLKGLQTETEQYE